LWKVGLTAQGGRAAASHTGALAARRDVWNGVVRQTGVIPVTGFEEWVDTMMAFNLLPRRVGRRIAVVSGPGGLAVAAAEAVGENGFELAELTERTKNELADIVPPTGTSLKNPIDVGLTASFDAAIYVGAVRAAASDPNVDALVVLGVGLTPEANQEFRQGVIDAQRRSQKPFLMVNIPGHNPEFGREFRNAGLPFFESAERAMAAFRRVSEHHAWQAAQISENS
jgi:acyl-CoA synthetase (NDP forming)